MKSKSSKGCKLDSYGEWMAFRARLAREDFGPIRPVYKQSLEPKLDLTSAESARATARKLEEWAENKAANDTLRASEEQAASAFLLTLIAEADTILTKAVQTGEAARLPTLRGWEAALLLMWQLSETAEQSGWLETPASETVFKEMALRLAYYPWWRSCLMQHIEVSCNLRLIEG